MTGLRERRPTADGTAGPAQIAGQRRDDKGRHNEPGQKNPTAEPPAQHQTGRGSTLETALAYFAAGTQLLGLGASDCHDPDRDAVLWAALQAADTAVQALAALHTADRRERLEKLREAVAGARATVLTCTMAIYRATGHPAADTEDVTDLRRSPQPKSAR
ncbi:hypothetical protein ACFYW6_37455 [Streptomyces sp. NPDC002659]|uniref:hypothetical protein n=1 Tax=Streptomyces sp. NPDC002659 TaxID=3364656 RepID=UPI00369DC734